MIDTTGKAKKPNNDKDKDGSEKDKSKKEDKEKEEKVEEEVAEVKLTPEETEKAKDTADKIFDKQIAEIFDKIIKKANLICKMAIHSNFKFEDSKTVEASQLRMIKAPTFYEAAKKEGVEIDEAEKDAEEG